MKLDLRPFLRALSRAGAATAAGLLLGSAMIAAAATPLADQPVMSNATVPGNLALALSVEWPTASRTAHTDNYTSASTYLGYFDPNKCYLYKVNTAANGVSATSKGDQSYFYPAGAATDRTCTGANDAKWSGNFLNWASTPTIDPFRWAMTGGRRVVDTVTDTILEKAWHSGQGLFPDRDLTVGEIAGATPYAGATKLTVSVANRGFVMRLTPKDARRPVLGEYWANPNMTGGSPALTIINDPMDNDWGTGSPGSGIGNDNFSARYTSTFFAPETGLYQFRVDSRGDDGVRLYLNDVLVINNWTGGSGNSTKSDTTLLPGVLLTAGQSVDLRLEYAERKNNAEIHLFWQPPSATKFTLFSTDSDATDFTMRVKVCDPSASAGPLEANCKAYGANYKPEGLMQQYAQKIRFSAFGYLNDPDSKRDGGVMRARQKFVGPTITLPGQATVTNAAKEWSETTGIFVGNPDAVDAITTTAATGVTVADSGVMNYLNKFGQLIPGDYKNNDPVSEMYYAVMRYYRNLGNVPAWTDMTGAKASDKTRWVDGFPVITSWDDPIQYSCQRNFVLGIGDIYTWNDKNVAGNTSYNKSEPSMPPQIAADTSVNAVTATDKVGQLQGLGAIGSTDQFFSHDNSAYIAGLAYDANTKDIRPDVTGQSQTVGKQTVQTYWVDVLEQPFQANNQFYLAAKFGGLDQNKLPAGFDPYSFAGTIPLDWWSTSGEKLTDTRTNTVQDRPNNYFAAGRPDTLVAALTSAFEAIGNEIQAFTTSFSLSAAQVTATGTASYAAQYDTKDWTGEVQASEINFAADGTPSLTFKWSSTNTLAMQLAGAGWDTARRVVTWNGSAGKPFRTGNLTVAQSSALDTIYTAGNDSSNYLNYLRGDRSQERTDTDTTKPYRKRSKLLGDIVNAKVTAVGAPVMRYSDVVNPGYANFKTTWSARPTMVYAAANDGMVHAFDGSLTGPTAGVEQFAYVPSAVYQGPSSPATPQLDGLAQLGNPNYLHHYYVDSTPQVFDIDFGKAGGTFTTTSAANSRWRSVLIGGLGKGGKSYYAIDVTDPAAMTSEAAVAGKVLWEFSDPDMGLSYAEPMVIKTKRFGWVVVLTSGYNNADGRGYLFFVHPETGALLQKVSTGTAATGMAYASAFITDFSDGVADAVYAGDLDGQMWRFDVTAAGAYPAPVKLATLTNAGPPGTAQPITTRPLIEIDARTRKRYVMFGTGQLLTSLDIVTGSGQSFYAIIDGTATAFSPADPSLPVTRAQLTALTNLTNGVTLPNTSRGWYLDLGTSSGTAWRLVAEPTAFSGIVAFAPLLPKGDVCSASGQSRIYAIDFATGKSVLTGVSNGYIDVGATVTDLRFVGVDGTVRLVSGDTAGALRNNPFTPPAGVGLRLLNWREVPTVN